MGGWVVGLGTHLACIHIHTYSAARRDKRKEEEEEEEEEEKEDKRVGKGGERITGSHHTCIYALSCVLSPFFLSSPCKANLRLFLSLLYNPPTHQLYLA